LAPQKNCYKYFFSSTQKLSYCNIIVYFYEENHTGTLFLTWNFFHKFFLVTKKKFQMPNDLENSFSFLPYQFSLGEGDCLFSWLGKSLAIKNPFWASLIQNFHTTLRMNFSFLLLMHQFFFLKKDHQKTNRQTYNTTKE